jgi:hypothetical protein
MAYNSFVPGVKNKTMRNRDHFHHRATEHHPRVAFGIFLIVLGIALLLAKNDVFNLGSTGAYFNWRTAMIFVGVLLLLNLEFTGGFLLIAAGVWFLQDELFPGAKETLDIYFWPIVIAVIGISFILSSFIRRRSIK